jgi:hypothetical protein
MPNFGTLRMLNGREEVRPILSRPLILESIGKGHAKKF